MNTKKCVRLVGYLIFFYIIHCDGQQQECVRDLSKVRAGRNCRKPCEKQNECKGGKKECFCDNWCGMSCINPKADCPAPEKIENGEIRGNVYIYSNEIEYSCLPGYVLEGESKRICQSDRKWSGTAPTCEPACGSPPRYSGAYTSFLKSGYAVGSKATYTCRFGYDLSGINEVECLPDFQWSDRKFECTKIGCGNPGNPLNGYIEGDDFTFGAWIVYHCNKGYEIDQPRGNRRLCSSNGAWSGTARECKKIKCPEPKNPENGFVTVSGSILEFRTLITYRCNRGYRLDGPNKGQCNEEGDWGPVPVCTVDVNCNFDSSASELCGYTNEGTGEWERHFILEDTASGHPSFVLRASFTPAVLRSPIILHSIPHCFKFYYRIKTSLTEKDSLVISYLNGNLLTSIHKKEPVKKWLVQQVTVLPDPDFHVIQFDISLKGTRSKIELDDFSLAQEECDNNCARNPCQNGGTCIDRVTKYICICDRFHRGKNCEEKIVCPAVKTPAFGSFRALPDPSSYGVDTIISFSCNRGYKISGPKSMTCKESGSWSEIRKRPVCIEIRCPAIDRVQNRKVSIYPDPRVMRVGTVAKFSCGKGQFLTGGPIAISCQENSKWTSDHRPQCQSEPVILKECPKGYKRLREEAMCYKVSTTKKTYFEAHQSCAADGAKLVNVQSAEKITKLEDLSVRRITYYIGLDDIGRKELQWTNGERFVKMKNFVYSGNYRSNKKISVDFRCAMFVRLTSRSVISVVSCNEVHRFICEKFASDAGPVEISSTDARLLPLIGVYRPMPGIIYNGAHIYTNKLNTLSLIRTVVNKESGWVLNSMTLTTMDYNPDYTAIQVISPSLRPENITEKWEHGKFLSEINVRNITVLISSYDQWKLWSEWSSCSSSCGDGTTQRSRVCDEEDGSPGLGDCRGEDRQTRECNMKKCISTKWSAWGAYTRCNLPCGGGIQERYRTCIKDEESEITCPGKRWQRESCNTHKCKNEKAQWITIGSMEYILKRNIVYFQTASDLCSTESARLAFIGSKSLLANIEQEAKRQHCESQDSRMGWEIWTNMTGENNIDLDSVVDFEQSFTKVLNARRQNCTALVHVCNRKTGFFLATFPCDQYITGGYLCEREIDPCRRNPCQNKGVCQSLSRESYKCTCVGNFRGKHCEKVVTCSTWKLAKKYKVINMRNRKVTDRLVRQGVQIKLECLDPNQITTSNEIFTCIGQNRWDKSSVGIECETRCILPRLPHSLKATESGIVVKPGDAFSALSRILFECKNGLDVKGARLIECRKDGTWDDAVPGECETGCRLMLRKDSKVVATNVRNGDIVKGGEVFALDTLLSFACEEDLFLLGNKTAACTETGWDRPMVQHCFARKACWKPATPKSGSLSFTPKSERNPKSGAVVTLDCDENYIVQGKESATCQLNGEWSNDLGSCQNAVGCSIELEKLPENFGVFDKNLRRIMFNTVISPNDYIFIYCKKYIGISCTAKSKWEPPMSCEATGHL